MQAEKAVEQALDGLVMTGMSIFSIYCSRCERVQLALFSLRLLWYSGTLVFTYLRATRLGT
ncbi:hypothetical protein BD413DRAFT_534225 [Trametes elegans]|nr:hypothetical protein BD413DRAFT_534225 [Trametes elegans]